MTDALKQCPFCGSKASVQKDITGKEYYHVVCNDRKCKCPMVAGMSIWRKTVVEAVEDWNRRNTDES